MDSVDVIIVGGGIAGGAMAVTLRRADLSVLVLERQAVYRDRVRGENMQPWGVVEAQKIGVFDMLREAGGHWAPRFAGFGRTDPATAEAEASNLGLSPEVPGALNFGHPAATQVLTDHAESLGATVLRGVQSVKVEPGDQPAVGFTIDGDSRRVRCRLVIGADGRSSLVRRQAGIDLRRFDAIHLISGVLIDDAHDWPEDLNASATEGDARFILFPQGGGRHRLYISHPLSSPHRFAGPKGPAEMLRVVQNMTVIPAERFAKASPSGPSATFPGDDSVCEQPFVDGVVLIGDAAGYNNPNIGQGLSIAMRDVRIVSELLASNSDWSSEIFAPYAAERIERMRRLRFCAEVIAALSCTFTPQDVRDADVARRKLEEDPSLGTCFDAVRGGPESVPESAFTEAIRERILSS